MGRDFELKIPGKDNSSKEILGSVIDRRQFIRYGFNTAAGVLATTFGVIGFAAILMPGGGGGVSAVVVVGTGAGGVGRGAGGHCIRADQMHACTGVVHLATAAVRQC